MAKILSETTEKPGKKKRNKNDATTTEGAEATMTTEATLEVEAEATVLTMEEEVI